jgi:hypothetical protein
MRTMLRRLALAAGLAVTIAACPPAIATAADESSTKTYEVRFDKSDPDGNLVWEGTTKGPAQGTVVSHPTQIVPDGDILLVTFVWEISAGRHSFTAVTTGTLNTVTGAVILDGYVTDGWLEGASVHEEGQLVDASLSRYQGVIGLTVQKSDR